MEIHEGEKQKRNIIFTEYYRKHIKSLFEKELALSRQDSQPTHRKSKSPSAKRVRVIEMSLRFRWHR